MTPGVHDFTIVRGTTQTLVFRLKLSDGGSPPVLTNMPFDDVIISIQPKNGTLINHAISDAYAGFFVSSAPDNEITWRPTPSESRSFPVGAKTTYEVEVRDGLDQLVYLTGTITASGGLNPDV